MMTRNCLAAILAVSFGISGCHSKVDSTRSTGNNSNLNSDTADSANENPHAGAALNDGRPLLVCFGDSLTAGYGAENGKSYPDFLQKDLDAKGYHYRVVNEGVSGATSKDGVTRLEEIAALKPAVVVVEFGGNDGLRGLPVGELQANLDTMVKGLQDAGAKVMVAGIILPPDYGPDYVSKFVATYPTVAKKYRVPLLPFLLQDVFGVDGMMQADLTHATAKGNAIVAQNVLPVVEPLLKK
jgi:acyl-CoA thioesterase-1